uniref:Uncharacterized protein n=1 Tax=Oryza meridionalis TaxID=40149 RepID=A0A0E0ECB8_9ORYZ
MASSSDVETADRFDTSGPVHMMAKNGASSSPIVIDWDNEEHRQCVAACLVNGVYTMENDSNRRRVHTNALAPAWWENFGFRLLRVIKDDSDNNDQFIIGVVYEHVLPASPAATHWFLTTLSPSVAP